MIKRFLTWCWNLFEEAGSSSAAYDIDHEYDDSDEWIYD